MDKLRDSLRVEKFNGSDNEDFSLWSLRVFAVLEGKGIHGVVDGTEAKPLDEASTEYTLYTEKCRMARAVIVTSLGDKPLRVIQNAKTPEEMWKKLNARYEAASTANKINLLTSLINIRYQSAKDMGDFISELETHFNKLACMGLPIVEEMQVAILLVSVMHEESMKSTVAALKTVDADRATWDSVCSRLLEERRSQKMMKGDTISTNVGTLRAASVRGKYNGSRMRCYKCNKLGHISRNCKSDWKEKRDNKAQTLRIATVSKENPLEKFVIDSGASQHISNCLEDFSSLEEITPVTVHLADNTTVSTSQQGSVSLHLKVDCKSRSKVTSLLLTNVLYIPNSAVKLISCVQLDKAGISTKFDNGSCSLIDRQERNTVIGHAYPSDSEGLYTLDASIDPTGTPVVAAIAQTAKINKGTDLWHRRLGHIGKDTVRSMYEKVEGMSPNVTTKEDCCETCVEAKQTKMPSVGRVVQLEEEHVIHSDIIGPISPETPGKSRYILTFIVEKSRFAKVCTLRNRSEVQSCLNHFIAWLERKTSTTVKRFHSDQAKEYVALKDFLNAKGIVQTMSSAYTPESNGLAERYNRTILQKLRAMLIESGLSSRFWGEAALHACHLTNVTPSSSNDKTPFESLFGRLPNIKKLRVFGCSAHYHIPEERRSWKLGSRSHSGIMMGLENGLYRIWDIEQERLVGTKHVIFEENSFPYQKYAAAAPTNANDANGSEISLDMDTAPMESSAPDNDPIQMERTSSDSSIIETNVDETVDNELPRYPQRVRTKPERFAYVARKCAEVDSPTLEEAISSAEKHEWEHAIREELASLDRTGTWNIVDRPKEAKVVPCKWVLKRKRNASGSVLKYKARLVICGNMDDGDVYSTFAPVVDITVIRLMLAIAAQKQWEVHQIDYSNAFLQGTLDREVYMTVPKFTAGDYSNKVCRLNKTLYGLRESPRVWYNLLSSNLIDIGLKPLESAPCVFVGPKVMVLCYVDDLLVMGDCEKAIKDLKQKFAHSLPANDLGKASEFLGMKLIQGPDYIALSQRKQIQALIDELGLNECREVRVPCDVSVDLSTKNGKDADEDFPYRRIIGILLYIATHTRPDIAVVTNMLARHVNEPAMEHQLAAVKVVRYLKFTIDHMLVLKPDQSNQLSAHVDANWAGEPGAGRRSRSGVLIRYGKAAVYFRTSLQKCVTLSSTEAEYVSLSESIKSILWLRRILNELDIEQQSTAIFQDNSGAITWSTGHPAEDFRRSKHIELRYHHVREKVASGEVSVKKICTREMAADFLTKTLNSDQLRKANQRVQVQVIGAQEVENKL